MKRKWLLIYLSVSVSFYFACGGYYILLKPRLYDLGANYFHIMLADSLPAFIALSSFLWGRFADIFSRKIILVTGCLGGVFVYLLGISKSIELILLFISLVSIFYSMVFPVINTAFSFEKKYSEAFGYFTAAQAAGWAFAGFITGIFSEFQNTGIKISYSLAGIIWVLSVILFYLFYPEHAEIKTEKKPKKIKLKKEFVFFLAGIFILGAGITLAYGLLSIRLYEILDKSKISYGLIWATFPAILSVIAGPLWGKIVGRWRWINILILLSIIYPLNIIALNFFPKIITVVLWALPLWNLMWVSILSASTDFSRGEERSTIMGLINGVVNVAISLTFFGGILADYTGRSAVVVLSGIFAFLSLLAFLKTKSQCFT